MMRERGIYTMRREGEEGEIEAKKREGKEGGER